MMAEYYDKTDLKHNTPRRVYTPEERQSWLTWRFGSTLDWRNLILSELGFPGDLYWLIDAIEGVAKGKPNVPISHAVLAKRVEKYKNKGQAKQLVTRARDYYFEWARGKKCLPIDIEIPKPHERAGGGKRAKTKYTVYVTPAAVWAAELEQKFKKQDQIKWKRDTKFRLEKRREILREALKMIPNFEDLKDMPTDVQPKEPKTLDLSAYIAQRQKIELAENERILSRLYESETVSADEIDDRLAKLDVYQKNTIGEIEKKCEHARAILLDLKATRLQRALNLGDEYHESETAESVPLIESANTSTKGYTEQDREASEPAEKAEKKGYTHVPLVTHPEATAIDPGEDPEMLTWALFWATQIGIPVFPVWGSYDGVCFCPDGADCRSNGKHPMEFLAPNGSHDATTYPEKIHQWWTKGPHANIGGAMGGPRRILGIDVDPRKNGLVSLQGLFAEHGELPITHRNRSGGQGPHYLVELPEGFTFRKGKLAEGIDLKHTGGYLVLPPSMHQSGNRYLVEDPAPIAPAPQWLLDILSQSQDATKVLNFTQDPYRVFTTTSNQAFGEGDRNEGLFKWGYGRWVNGWAVDMTELHHQLSEANATRCNPPLSGSEVAKLAAHITQDYPRGELKERRGTAA